MKKLSYLFQLVSLIYATQANAYAASCVDCDIKDTQPKGLLQLRNSALQLLRNTGFENLVQRQILPIRDHYAAIEYGETLLPIVFDQKSGAPLLKNKDGKTVPLSKLKGPQRLYRMSSDSDDQPEFLGLIDPQTAQVDSQYGELVFESKHSQHAQWYNGCYHSLCFKNWRNWDNW